jgi:UTP--glucose-1-phosphate uridylyltransferase
MLSCVRAIHIVFLQDTLQPMPSRAFGSGVTHKEQWYPPGHGDVYQMLYTSGLLENLINQGKEYIFISNIDNLGATVDLKHPLEPKPDEKSTASSCNNGGSSGNNNASSSSSTNDATAAAAAAAAAAATDTTARIPRLAKDAVLDLKLLYHLVDSEVDFALEVIESTRADTEGGLLVGYEGKPKLLEMSQLPNAVKDDFRKKFQHFNTNNIWVNLR